MTQVELASHLEALWGSADFQVWRTFIDNQISAIRDEIEFGNHSFDERTLRDKLIEISVLRRNFVEMFKEWKEIKKEIQQDGEFERSDGPIV